MSVIKMAIHRVDKIELSGAYLSNSNSRTLAITYDDGKVFEVNVYGNTDALDALPKSDRFREYI